MPRVRGNCPRCRTAFDLEVEAGGFFLCPGCGARLKSRGAPPPPSAPAPEGGAAPKEEQATPTPGAASTGPPAAVPAPSPPPPQGEPAPSPPSAAASPVPPDTAEAAAPAQGAGLPAGSPLEEVVYGLYATQREMLELMRARLGPTGGGPEAPGPEDVQQAVSGEDVTAFPPAPARARKRKSVLLIDDDEVTRSAASQALATAEVPIRIASTGAETLAALTSERPDVIVLEPELSGDMTGDDLVNTIKATIEWVDIPIVLYTRAAVQSQDEARVRGADEFVLKGPQGADALVSHVITLFRKG